MIYAFSVLKLHILDGLLIAIEYPQENFFQENLQYKSSFYQSLEHVPKIA